MKCVINTDFENPQKDIIEIESRDLWNLNHQLAKVIQPCIAAFLEKHESGGMQGHPFIHKEDLLNNVKVKPENYNEDGAWCHESWIAVLEKINWAFQAIKGEFDEDTMKFSVMDQYREHEEKIQEGLNLFAKYYKALWD